MQAMILKEFRQMRRDRRTMALLFMVPLLMLTVFGYAARFDVKTFRLPWWGRSRALKTFGAGFDVVARQPSGDAAAARRLLRDSKAHVALVTSGGRTAVLIDGSELFSAQSALRRLGSLPNAQVQILYNRS